MPIYERQVDIYDGISLDQMQKIDQPEPITDSSTIWGAAWETTATKRAFDWFEEPSYQYDKDFKVDWSSLPEDQRHIFPELKKAGSQQEYDSIIERDRKNTENYNLIANSGTEGILASLATGILDPITLPLWFVPFVGTGFKAAGAAGRIGRIAAYTSADMAARETIMHHAEPGRTANDTYKNMLIAASVSTALGVMSLKAIKQTPLADRNRVVNEAKRHADFTADIEINTGSTQSVGAMYAGPVKPSLDLEGPAKGAEWWRKTMIQTPVLRSAFSTSEGLAAPAKRISELVFTGVIKKKHLQGMVDDYTVPIDVQAAVTAKINRSTNVIQIKAIRKEFKQKGINVKAGDLNKYIESTIVYGDDWAGLPDALIPHRELLLPMVKRIRGMRDVRLDRLLNTKMLKGDIKPKYNKFYGPRMFDKKEMDALPKRWLAGVIRGYRAEGDTRTFAALEERALQTYRNANSTAKDLDHALSGVRSIPRTKKTVKGITMGIQDEYVEGFLIRDVVKAEEYLDRLEGELLLRERYGTANVTLTDRGIVDVKEITAEYDDEFKEVYTKLLNKNETVKAGRLLKKHEVYVLDRDHVLAKIVGHGNYDGVITGKVATFLNETRAWTSAAWNGNSVIASIQEPMKNAINHGFGPMLSSTKVIAFDRAATKQSREMMKSFGVGIDMNSHKSAALARAEIDDSGLADGWATVGSRKMSPALYFMNGQNLFNDFFKTGGATVHGDQLIKYALGKQATKVGSPEYKMSIAEFAKFGMGSSQMKMVKQMVKEGKGYTDVNGVLFPNLDEWANTEIADAVGQSMLLYADSIVLAGGTGTVPRILDNPLGAMITQFKRILFNMQGQTVVPLAQRMAAGDMRAARGMTAMLGMAWVQHQFRLGMSVGFDPDEFEKKWNSMSTQDHVFQAYDRSGLGTLMTDLFSSGDNILEGNISSSLGINQSTKRYHQRATGIGNIMPAFSFGEKVVRAGLSPFSEDGFQQADGAALGMSLPLRNIFYWDYVLDEMQNATLQYVPNNKQNKNSKLKKLN